MQTIQGVVQHLSASKTMSLRHVGHRQRAVVPAAIMSGLPKELLLQNRRHLVTTGCLMYTAMSQPVGNTLALLRLVGT